MDIEVRSRRETRVTVSVGPRVGTRTSAGHIVAKVLQAPEHPPTFAGEVTTSIVPEQWVQLYGSRWAYSAPQHPPANAARKSYSSSANGFGRFDQHLLRAYVVQVET